MCVFPAIYKIFTFSTTSTFPMSATNFNHVNNLYLSNQSMLYNICNATLNVLASDLFKKDTFSYPMTIQNYSIIMSQTCIRCRRFSSVAFLDSSCSFLLSSFLVVSSASGTSLRLVGPLVAPLVLSSSAESSDW